MDDQPKRAGRRRRNLGGGRAATEAHDGIRDTSYHETEDDNIAEPISPAALNARVAALPEEEDFTPKGRMQEVTTRASEYEREYRLKLLHRLIMRGVPVDKIADELGMSVNSVMADRKELYARLREQASKMDINELIGTTMGFYGEVQGMALRQASNNSVPMNIRLSALRTALGAKNDSHRFLQAAGVFDVLSFKAGEDAAQSDIERLVDITERLMSDEDANESLARDIGLDVESVHKEKEEMEAKDSLRYF